MTSSDFKLGITETFPCNYLPQKEERLLIAVDERLHNSKSYAWLMTQGFRRSGDQAYRPHCEHCNACQSLRVIASEFSPSKSQRRNLKRNQQLTLKTSNTLKSEYYPLFEEYINTCHQDGTMYPANYSQFESFLSSSLTQQLFIEIWQQTEDGNSLLVSVAVTDVLSNGLSAVYTFYSPSLRNKGIGVYSILMQIKECQKLHKEYLYLGYQIDDCKKMNYKNRYFPFEKFINGQWHRTDNVKNKNE